MSEKQNPPAQHDTDATHTDGQQWSFHDDQDDTKGHQWTTIDDQDGADGQPGYSGALNPDIDVPS
ncbi:MAG: hypothetical protein QOG01_4641 [Pseudonocardiales bacterium]|jgi:hypothetical protein|nr:hypothetical protein [Pseudonocardiales bacterium]